jgi:hypothetical protein
MLQQALLSSLSQQGSRQVRFLLEIHAITPPYHVGSDQLVRSQIR